jgi:O-antigen ligase
MRAAMASTRIIVLAGTVAVAVMFVRDSFDRFRLPKTLILEAEAILLLAVALAAILLRAPPRVKWRDPRVLLPLLGLAVMAVLTMTSTKPALSASALVVAAATLVIFFATVAAARDGGWLFVGVPLAAAAANALLVIVEELNLWMPFGEQRGVLHHLQCTALVGNPNEVGGYLGVAALACLAMLAARRAWTFWSVAAAVVLIAGLIASRTLTSMVAFAAGALVMLAMSSWKQAVRAAVVIALAGVLLSPIRERVTNMVRWAKSGDYNTIFTERLTPFVAAWSMFTDHPLLGVGPGTYAWHYYDYKIRAEARYPALRHTYNRGFNAGEAHNDHLQLLAEGGIVGYAAAAALIGALAFLSFTIPKSTTDARRQFARRMAASLAVYWVVLSLAQFPLETAVVRSLLVHFAAVCIAWSDEGGVAAGFSRPSSSGRLKPAPTRIAGVLLIAAAAAYSLYQVVYVPLRCARAASVGAAALGSTHGDAAIQREADRVRASLRGCECVSAREAHIPFMLAGVLTTLDDNRAAIAEYERALTIEQRPEIYFDLGMAHLAVLERDAAIANLTRACAFDPARLADIPYPDIRDEIERRLRATYGADWVR